MNIISLEDMKRFNQFRTSNIELVIRLLCKGSSVRHAAYTLGISLSYVEGIKERLDRGVFDSYLKTNNYKKVT